MPRVMKDAVWHKTYISEAVELDGHAGHGYALASARAVDKAIDHALYELAGEYLSDLRLVSVTHSPVRYGNMTCLVVTVLARPYPNPEEAT